MMLGKAWPETIGLPRRYFDRRDCLIDCRGPIAIDTNSRWGFQVCVITESHAISNWPELGKIVSYGVTIEKDVWIGSRSMLTGCHIREGTIVAAGSVVRGQTVDPYVMVAGNPARVIARWDGRQWNYLPADECGFYRELF